MSDCEAVVIFCTAPNEAGAQELAARVLDEKLSTRATLLPSATSLYYWEGKLEQEYEVQLLSKSNRRYQEARVNTSKQRHPYQTPELLVLPVMTGDKDYLLWTNVS